MSAGIQPDNHSGTVLTADRLTIGLLERLRLILRGGSIIDWYRLDVQSSQDVAQLLEVNGFRPELPGDVARIRTLLRMAHHYLQQELDIHLPRAIWDPVDIVDPFILASDTNRSGQRDACILLKVLHTIHHAEARELRQGLALSEFEVMARVEQRVSEMIGRLMQEGYPIHQFAGSRKTRASTITKLLSKRRASAAQILDRLRFRIVVESEEDLPTVLAAMTRCLIPYNYVVPEETTNTMLDFRGLVMRLPHLCNQLDRLQFGLELEERDPLSADLNECSSDDFRMLNFVIDLPVRVDDVTSRPENVHLRRYGFVVFNNVEFQVFDSATWEANERSDAASHHAYKERQRMRVRQRLFDGLERTPRTLDSMPVVRTVSPNTSV